MKKRSKPLEDTVELNEEEILASFRTLMRESSEKEMVEREMDLYINVNHIEKETTLPIVIDERKVDLRLPFDCILLADNLPGMCHILFSHEKSAFDKSNRDSIICECKLLINSDDYKLLFKDKSSLSEIRKFASTYAQLSESQRNFLKEQFSSQKEEEINNDFEPIVDEEGLRLLYNSCKHAYSPEIQKHAGLLFKELDQQRYGSNNRADILLKLSYMLNCKTSNSPKPDLTYSEVVDTLDRYIYGMKKVKKLIANRIMLSQHSGRTLSLLLYGSPGVGKTSVAKPIAKVYQLPYAEIKCESTDSIALTGLVSSYGGALPSTITSCFHMYSTTQILLLFEEIDKLSCDVTKANPYSVFNTMLGPQRSLHDEYLGVDIDVSNTVIVATANDISKIPSYILERFDVKLNIDDYSYDEKINIAKSYAIPELLNKNKVMCNDIIFDDDVLLMIIQRYCDDAGVRKLRSCLESLIASVVSGWKQNKLSKPFKITQNFVATELDELYLPDKKTSIGFTG